jgi:hypothetical protein
MATPRGGVNAGTIKAVSTRREQGGIGGIVCVTACPVAAHLVDYTGQSTPLVFPDADPRVVSESIREDVEQHQRGDE